MLTRNSEIDLGLVALLGKNMARRHLHDKMRWEIGHKIAVNGYRKGKGACPG